MTEQIISTDVAVVKDADKQMAALAGKRDEFMTTLDTSTDAGKAALYNALSDAEALSDHLNVPIEFAGYSAQIVEFADEDGVLQEGMRIIITSSNGKSYASMSNGIVKALKNIVAVFGDPSSWDSPKTVRAVEEGKKPRAYYTLKLVTK